MINKAALGLVICLAGAILSAQSRLAAQIGAGVDASLARNGVDSAAGRADVVVRWNELAHDIALADDQFRTFKGQRALAMMHLAIHDALNSIVPAYARYAYRGRPQIAHPVAAAAHAGYSVLVALYPDQQTRLDAELQLWLARTPHGRLRDRGIELGRRSAAAILARRVDDGWDFQGTYEFRSEPGQYQTTPPWNGFVAQPGFRFARPFVLAAPAHVRPVPPPPLTSAAYAAALREVQEYGAADSTRRTEEQTAYAVWWMEFAEGSVIRLARQLTTGHDVHLWTAARLFAHIGMALFDTYIAVWDSKYGYNHWRPYTAIREADADDNARTVPQPQWEPLRPTPPFPEYVSAHAAGCAASFGVLDAAFKGSGAFTMETTTAPPGMPTRTFSSFRAAALECADSRVRLGWHFRYATDAGHLLGRLIARSTLRHSLQRSDGWER
jgi:PAP2 superfamily